MQFEKLLRLGFKDQRNYYRKIIQLFNCKIIKLVNCRIDNLIDLPDNNTRVDL